MRLVVIGVNHKTAPVALRERLAFVGGDINIALGQLKSFTDGCVIVSTCNRTEIYALMPAERTLPNSDSHKAIPESSHESGTSVISNSSIMSDHINTIKIWLADFKKLPLAEIDPYLYVHRDSHAITHWLRVAAGLDSMILGEPQILGQIKQAVQLAHNEQAVSGQLSWIIDQVFAASKRVRN